LTPAEKERLKKEAGERGLRLGLPAAQAPRLKAVKLFSPFLRLLPSERPSSAIRPLEIFTATVTARLQNPRSNTLP